MSPRAKQRSRVEGELLASSAITKVVLKVPVAAFRQGDLLEFASYIDRSVEPRPYTHAKFSIQGRELDVEAEAASDLLTIDWPDTVRGFHFIKRTDRKEIFFSIKRDGRIWHPELSVSGSDVIWVKGTAAHLETLVKRRKNFNGLWGNSLIALAFGILITAMLVSAVWLITAALNLPTERGEWGHELRVWVTAILIGILLPLVAFFVPAYLFPDFEFYGDSSIPSHVKVRSWILGVGGALFIAILASLIAAGLIVLL
jgi:hypothetical protein